MSPGLKILLILGVTAVVLAIAAIAQNRAPLLASPGFGPRLWLYLTTHTAATNPDSARPELRTRRYPVTVEAMHAAIVDSVQSLGWQVVGDAPMKAVVTSSLLRFRDDVEIQVAADGDGVRVDVLSSSRVGRGDFGANVRHVLDVYREIEEKLGPGGHLETSD